MKKNLTLKALKSNNEAEGKKGRILRKRRAAALLLAAVMMATQTVPSFWAADTTEYEDITELSDKSDEDSYSGLFENPGQRDEDSPDGNDASLTDNGDQTDSGESQSESGSGSMARDASEADSEEQTAAAEGEPATAAESGSETISESGLETVSESESETLPKGGLAAVTAAGQTESQSEEDQSLAEESTTETDDSTLTETPSEEDLRKAEQGSAMVNVTVQLDFRSLPSSTIKLLKDNSKNPIKYYTVTIRDCGTNEVVFRSEKVKPSEGTDPDGIKSLQPVTFTADWDMGDSDPETGKYKDLSKTYAVSVTVPHFKPIAEKLVTIKVWQTEETETEKPETEEPETKETENPETGKTETEQVETGKEEAEKPKLQLPQFTWNLNADGRELGEKDPDATITFLPEVDVNTDPLTFVTVSNLTRIGRPYGKALEGGTLTSGYIVSSFLKPAGMLTNPLVLLRRGTYELLGSTFAPTDLGHSNDMTYIAARDEIYTTAVKYDGTYQLVVMDASTLQVKRRIKVDQYYSAISYDETRDCFFLVSHVNSLLNVAVYNGDFTQKISAFSIRSNLTYQGCGTWNGLFYFTEYERGSASQYEPVPDGRLHGGDNLIAVYDIYGHLLKTYYIPASGNGTHHEIETVMFDGGRMIIQCNENGRAGYYAVDPEKCTITLAASVSVTNSSPKDGQFCAGLYLNGERIKTAKSRGGAFTFSDIEITQPGSFLYQIRQDKGRDWKNIIYSDDMVSILVTALYDPFTNKLTVNTSYQSGSVISNYRFTSKEKKKLTRVWKSRPAVYYVKAGKKKLKVKYRKVAYAQGYQIQICRKRSFKGKTLQTITTRKLNRTIKRLTRKKIYYVRVRAYRVVRGVTYYGNYSGISSVKVK